MDSRLVLSFTLFVIVVAVSLAKQSQTSSFDGKTRNFTYVGSVDGKTYFAEQTLLMDWSDASSLCNASQMHLATVTSVKQRNLLFNAYWKEPFGYWTGGRDSQRLSQFSWEYNNELLNPYVINNMYYDYPVSTCVYLNGYLKYFSSISCYREFRPLCEFMHGK